MIYVNQKQLDQVEYLIEQSSRGHHILFDTKTIREVFQKVDFASSRAAPPKNDKSTTAQKHIENLILQPTLMSKKAYLENLHPEMFDRVVRTYFSIVENNIFEGLKFCQ